MHLTDEDKHWLRVKKVGKILLANEASKQAEVAIFISDKKGCQN
jgi:hypothetical protein